MKDYKDVLEFWFSPENIDKHFEVNEDFDELIRKNFFAIWEKGKEGMLVDWRETARGRLAEIIVLDQFSRNMFRNDVRSYSQDSMAVVLAQELVKMKEYNTFSDDEKRYVLLPFMHSESLSLHRWARPYFEDLGGAILRYEDAHLEVLKKFGRYPYQNKDLGRESTSEEIRALEENKNGFYTEV